MTTDSTSPAGIDLDAITKRARRVYPKRGWDGGEAERALPVVTEDVPALVARARDLTEKLDAAAQAFDELMAQVWRATGETHEPPADVAALLARVAAARREGAEAMREACAKTCDRRAEVLDATLKENLIDEPYASEERGAWSEAVDLAAALRALPLPGGEP